MYTTTAMSQIAGLTSNGLTSMFIQIFYMKRTQASVETAGYTTTKAL